MPHLVILPGREDSDDLARLARPKRLTGLVELDDVERHRSLLCDYYDECLDSALAQGWQSWSCEQCPLFVLAEGYRSRRTDHDGALRPSA
jgi:hypothetical protein